MSEAERLAILERVMDLPGFPKSSGMRVVAAEPGKVTMALKKRPDLTQFFGHFHGGVITALADHAAAVVRLIEEEVSLRQKAGQTVDDRAVLARFPQYRAERDGGQPMAHAKSREEAAELLLERLQLLQDLLHRLFETGNGQRLGIGEHADGLWRQLFSR